MFPPEVKEVENVQGDVGQEILKGLRGVKAFKAGKKSLRMHSFRVPSPRKVIRAT
jgi:hypothetical protein